MRLYLLLAVGCFVQMAPSTRVAADGRDDQQLANADQPNADQDAADKQPQPAAKPIDSPRRTRVPKHIAAPNPNAQPTPHPLLTDQHLYVPESAQRQHASAKQDQPKQVPRQQALPPARGRPNPPFWSPRRAGLSASATYRLESMGNHVHLSPAMRWHLNRSERTPNNQPTTTRSSAAKAPGQGAEQFYPGVSRLPQQKPFSDLERPPSGLQSYWPLLLEGREDPNTGLIIWTLP
ncbi:MAG: hypothetical protein AAGD11_05075 [Planctomycetota bacterium]